MTGVGTSTRASLMQTRPQNLHLVKEFQLNLVTFTVDQIFV